MGNFFDFRQYGEFLQVDMRKQAIHDYEWFNRIVGNVKPYIGDLKGKKLLDVGCGQNYPLTLLFHSCGVQSTGIDVQYVGAGDPSIVKWYRSLLRNGALITGGRLAYAALGKRRTYYDTLGQLCNFPLEQKGIDIRVMSAEKMNFPDNTFDLIVSVAVFEHIRDVSKAITEIGRVMCQNGVAFINIHLFTSLSGGHRRFPEYPSTWAIPPWDHLRGNKYPAIGFVNGLREHEYLSLFRDKLRLLEVIDVGKGEGKELLTHDLRKELSAFSEDELTKRGITVIATKP